MCLPGCGVCPVDAQIGRVECLQGVDGQLHVARHRPSRSSSAWRAERNPHQPRVPDTWVLEMLPSVEPPAMSLRLAKRLVRHMRIVQNPREHPRG